MKTKKKKLSENRKLAIAVAKDVIAQLDAKKYKAERGTYFELSNVEGFTGLGNDSEVGELTKEQIKLLTKSAQEVLKDKKTKCTVCAVGSALASYIRLKNKASIQDLLAIDASIFDVIEDVGMTDVFPDIYEMENYFESYSYNKSDDKALREIMQNIIKNDGRFTLKDEEDNED